MSNLESRKTKLQFTTASTIRDGRRHRAIVVEVEPTFVYVRLARTRARYTIPFDAIYSAAVKMHVAAERREKLAAKKAGRR
jgi:hypothetical protein